ncbi:MAG: DUF5076 domain-containing protein [Gemmataceae bacterium]
MSEHLHDEHCNHVPQGIDLIRLTYHEEQLYCSLDPSLFADDPATWGVVLADLTRNISESLSDDPARQREILQGIYDNYLQALSAALNESSK